MASLAGILRNMGFKVHGSDQNVYPPMSTQLQNLQIPIIEGYRPENLHPRPELVIVGNVISASNPEAQALLNSDIPYCSLPEAIGTYVIGDRESIVIAGTHGKTTTTSMATVVTETLGFQPGFLVGGIPLNYGFSFREPKGNWFVIEGDEYDTAFFDKVPKFIHYRPRHVILTSIEFDHADIYRDLEHVKDAFRQLLRLIPSDGTLIYNAEDANIRAILSETKCQNVFGYGEKQGDYTLSDRAVVQGRNQFSVHLRGQNIGDVAMKYFGIHNSLNALSVYALSHARGWNLSQTLQALANFKGVKRRQELLFEEAGRIVIEDFAHHPTAVRLTLASIREQFPGRRVIGVFEPRSATSRRKVFQKDYVQAFLAADVSCIAQPYDTSRIDPAQTFSTEQLVADLKAAGHQAFVGESTTQIVQELKRSTQSGDVILIMSNGGFDGIYGKLREALKDPSHSSPLKSGKLKEA